MMQCSNSDSDVRLTCSWLVCRMKALLPIAYLPFVRVDLDSSNYRVGYNYDMSAHAVCVDVKIFQIG